MNGIVKCGDKIWYDFRDGVPHKYLDLKVVKTNAIMLVSTVAMLAGLYLIRG